MTGQRRIAAGSSSRFRSCVGCWERRRHCRPYIVTVVALVKQSGWEVRPRFHTALLKGVLASLVPRRARHMACFCLLWPALACPRRLFLAVSVATTAAKELGTCRDAAAAPCPDMFRGVRHFALFLKKRPRGCLAASRSGCRSRRVWRSEQAIAGMHYSLNRCSWGLQ